MCDLLRGLSRYFLRLRSKFRGSLLRSFPILAHAAANKTRFFTAVNSRFVEWPKAFAAIRTPFNWFCNSASCVPSFLSHA
jgi:hypothetical protein